MLRCKLFGFEPLVNQFNSSTPEPSPFQGLADGCLAPSSATPMRTPWPASRLQESPFSQHRILPVSRYFWVAGDSDVGGDFKNRSVESPWHSSRFQLHY